MASFTVGDVTLTRVGYFDVALDAAAVGLTADQVKACGWSTPTWATSDGQVMVGQAVWVVESGGRVIVVDPCGAADPFLRTGPQALDHQEAVLDALSASGIPAGTVDTVVLSHLDGIGMAAAVDEVGDWAPLFPRARVVLTQPELERVRAHPEIQGAEALEALASRGVVEAIACPWEAAPGVTLVWTGAHTPGHAVLRIGDGAVFLGHLAVNPVHAVSGLCLSLHTDPPAALAAMERELAAAAEEAKLMIGPLWPAPGAGLVTGPPWRVTPA